MDESRRETVRMKGGRIQVVLPDDARDQLTTLAMKKQEEADANLAADAASSEYDAHAHEIEDEDGGTDDD